MPSFQAKNYQLYKPEVSGENKTSDESEKMNQINCILCKYVDLSICVVFTTQNYPFMLVLNYKKLFST